MGVGDIFAEHGEQEFRMLERDAIADAVASPVPLVIACGGGTVLDADNRRSVPRRRRRRVARRVACRARRRASCRHGPRQRPLLAGAAPPAATLERLSAQREPAYEAAAHVQVDTEGRTVDEVAAAVIEEFDAWNG